MATYTARAGAIIDAITDPVVKTAAQKEAIADRFCLYLGFDELTKRFGTPDNPATPENEEVKITALSQLTLAQKSAVLVEIMARAGKSVLRKQAEDAAKAEAQATIEGAGDTGEGEL